MRLEEIKAILGPIDDALAVEISQTDASAEDLAQAWAWVNADEALINEGRPLPSGRVGDLVALLQASELDPEK
jgi:hypothetical protein